MQDTIKNRFSKFFLIIIYKILLFIIFVLIYAFFNNI